jgi:hypothetical protein
MSSGAREDDAPQGGQVMGSDNRGSTGRGRAWLMRIAARVDAWFRSASLDRDLDDELRTHLEMLTGDLVRGGMPAAEARRAARLQLGATQPLAEQHRRIRGPRRSTRSGATCESRGDRRSHGPARPRRSS